MENAVDSAFSKITPFSKGVKKVVFPERLTMSHTLARFLKALSAGG